MKIRACRERSAPYGNNESREEIRTIYRANPYFTTKQNELAYVGVVRFAVRMQSSSVEGAELSGGGMPGSKRTCPVTSQQKVYRDAAAYSHNRSQVCKDASSVNVIHMVLTRKSQFTLRNLPTLYCRHITLDHRCTL